MTEKPDHHILIVGAGFSGIGAAIQLDRAGLSDYLLLEAADGAGGTWHWNTYPGIAVDIPSFSYQFSFEQSTDWSRTYAPGRELKAYADHCVDKYGIRSRIRFSTKVLHAEFDDEHEPVAGADRPGRRGHRQIHVNACGVLTSPKLPDIAGVDGFAGRHDAHRAVGSHPGPGRQARRDHRHRRLGRADHPRDRADRLPAHRVPAHARSGASPNSMCRCRSRPAGRCAFRAANSSNGCSAKPSSK